MPFGELFFADIPDPRAANVSHRLSDLLVMMVAAGLCGATTATEIALFAEERRAVMQKLVRYEDAPSHDTFSRLLRLLDPKAFAAAFARLASAMHERLADSGAVPGAIALDGKAMRRAYDPGHRFDPPTIVNAFATGAGLCLGTVEMAEGGEAAAALAVIDLLDLAGKTVTADAGYNATALYEKLADSGADYIIRVKPNTAKRFRAAERAFAGAQGDQAQNTANAHGRQEWRGADVVAAQPPMVPGQKAWGRVVARRDGAAEEVRIYALSRPIAADKLIAATREHWRVENTLHWVLDVHLGEDQARARKDNAPANLAVIKRLVRNMLQTADHPKVPISHRIKKCAWSDEYLINAIRHMR